MIHGLNTIKPAVGTKIAINVLFPYLISNVHTPSWAVRRTTGNLWNAWGFGPIVDQNHRLRNKIGVAFLNMKVKNTNFALRGLNILNCFPATLPGIQFITRS